MVSTVSLILPFTPPMNVSRINCGRDCISLNIVFSDRSKLRGDVVIRNKLHDMGPKYSERLDEIPPWPNFCRGVDTRDNYTLGQEGRILNGGYAQFLSTKDALKAPPWASRGRVFRSMATMNNSTHLLNLLT